MNLPHSLHYISMQAQPARSLFVYISQVQVFRYAVWFSYLDIVPNRNASVTHLDQGKWKKPSFQPLAFSPRKPLVPCRVQVFNIGDVTGTNRWLAHYSLASRPFLIRGTGVTESTLTYKMVMRMTSMMSSFIPQPLITSYRYSSHRITSPLKQLFSTHAKPLIKRKQPSCL